MSHSSGYTFRARFVEHLLPLEPPGFPTRRPWEYAKVNGAAAPSINRFLDHGQLLISDGVVLSGAGTRPFSNGHIGRREEYRLRTGPWRCGQYQPSDLPLTIGEPPVGDLYSGRARTLSIHNVLYAGRRARTWKIVVDQ